MPRYFFHIHDDLDTEDDEGLELPDLDAAVAGAVISARALMCETLKDGRIDLDHRIDIENAGGLVLTSVLSRDVVSIESKGAGGPEEL